MIRINNKTQTNYQKASTYRGRKSKDIDKSTKDRKSHTRVNKEQIQNCI
jgi:hypothetical protein